jgi:molybdopterin-guanine dinucleotide biosynthesis protein
MPTLVIGGHTRNIGKTSVVAGIIAALPELQWTAIKITQYGHGVCSANGEPCDCQTDDHSLAITEERDATSGTDTARYLAAGAVRSLWVRTRQGDLASAMPRVRDVIARTENVIVESNSVLRFLQPTLSVTVLDPTVVDFKPSALRYLDRVDALLVPARAEAALLHVAGWPEISARVLQSKSRFLFTAPEYCPPALIDFVRERLGVKAAQVPVRA